MLRIVVAPDLPGAAGGTHAFDHRIVVERIGQDQAIRKQPCDRRDARMVGHVARCENERRFLAMPSRPLVLELSQRPIRTRDVACPARARARRARGGAHCFDHLRMLAHAEIIAGAPYDDVTLAVRTVPERMGELSGCALEVGENAVALLAFQRGDGRLKTPDIVEHLWKSFSRVVRETTLSCAGRRRSAPRRGSRST